MRFHPVTGHRTYVPFPDDARLLVFDTQTPRSLSSTEYNRCVKVAEKAAEKLGFNKLSEYRPGNEHLLTEEEARVLAHHTGESRRVETFLRALADKDLVTAGKAMRESHESLRDNLRVSCPELESFVELATQQDSVYGARLTGAGFGGCAIALVDARYATTVSETIQSQFQERHQKGEGWVSEICGTGATEP
jgi:galactokinase